MWTINKKCLKLNFVQIARKKLKTLINWAQETTLQLEIQALENLNCRHRTKSNDSKTKVTYADRTDQAWTKQK